MSSKDDIRLIAAKWIKRFGETAPQKLGEKVAEESRAGNKAAAQTYREIATAAERQLNNAGRKNDLGR